MPDKLYIGEKEVKMVLGDPEDNRNVNVELQGHQKINMRRSLFDLIAKKEKGNGNVTDCVRAYIAQKFVLELGLYGLVIRDVVGIAEAMGTLIHNLSENKIGEKFGCTTSDTIPLESILKD